MSIKSINPTTEETLKEFNEHSETYVQEAIERSVQAFTHQKAQTFKQRAVKMNKVADILEKNADKYAQLMTQEMGKPIAQAKAEAEKCAWVCRFYAENAEKFLSDKQVKTDKKKSYVTYLPIGPILAVMPWNFPMWQVIRFAAPALMAGNTAILKHASNVPQTALLIEEIYREAGFDAHEFQTLLISSHKVEEILKDDRVRAATLTGSEGAGRAVASLSGNNIKKTVLELGGSDPFIVMPTADMDNAIEMAVKGRTQNNGQSCIAAKRFIVHAAIYDEFKKRFVEEFEKLKVGDPLDKETDIGPLATAQIADELAEQVDETVKKGAKLLVGGKRLKQKGYFVSPGIMEDIPEDAPAYTEELFGPVACLFKVSSLEEAVILGNITRFGLGSAIFTQDETEKGYAVKHLDAGSTFINTIVASDPRLPFGGVKASGYGRELGSEGIHEFVNVKTIAEA